MSHSVESPHEFEFEPLGSTTVTLSQAAIEWAVQVCQQNVDIDQQWRTFLRAMALQGFQQWLEAGALAVPLSYPPNQAPASGVNCEARGFRLCLIAEGGLSDQAVHVPRETLDDPHSFAHLYLLLQVQEEADRVTILAGLRRDRLLAYQQQSGLAFNPAGDYAIPIACFDTSPDEVLLYLHCLNPDMLNPDPSAATGAISAPTPLAPSLRADVSVIETSVINVGRWLQGQMDAVAESLAWTLMPPLAAAHGLRGMQSPVEALADILTELENDLRVPDTVRAAYLDYPPTLGATFRLYALTWLLDESEPTWSLLLFLGPHENNSLPPGIQLIVRDQQSVLAAPILTEEADSTYLYAQVIGALDEQFTVTVQLPNGTALNWPPFVFRPD